MKLLQHLRRTHQDPRRDLRAAKARRALRPRTEGLEERTLLSASLSLSGTQSISVGTNVDASNTSTISESEMSVAINPTNPLNVVGFTHNVQNLDQIQLFSSVDGGSSWSRALISDSGANNDGLGSGIRYDPSLAFDATGVLHVVYGCNGGSTATVVAARSLDGGRSINAFRYLDTQTDIGATPGVDKWTVTAGPDGRGGQAVYVAYTQNVNEAAGLDQRIVVSGSDDLGNSFTVPAIVNDGSFFGTSAGNLTAGPAVGPNGQLYIVWHDIFGGAIKIVTDPDGLFSGSQGFGSDVTVRTLRTSLFGFTPPAAPNRGFSAGPVIDVARTGAFAGRVYVAFTDQFSGNDTDIYLAYSDNQGATFTDPGSAGNVEGHSSTDFMPWLAVDQTTGSVNVGYYTTDGSGATNTVNYRLATSLDGGGTFLKSNLSSATSNISLASTGGNDFGDYVGLAAYDGVVRGYWTDNRGNASFTESETAAAALVSSTLSNTLFVYGDDSGVTNDTITLRVSPVNSSYLEVDENGAIAYIGLLASINSVQVYGGAGNDTINVESTDVNAPVTVNLGGGADTVNISPTARNLSTIGSNVTIHGGSGHDKLFIDDQANPAFSLYTLTQSSVSRFAFTSIDYNSIDEVVVNGGLAADTYNVQGTEASFATTLRTGPAADVVNVQATTGTLTVGSAGGVDTVNVGSGGNAQGIVGTLNIVNAPDHTIINVDDSADGGAHTVTMGSYTAPEDGDFDSDLTGYIAGLTPGNINYEYFDTQSLSVQTGTGVNTLFVQATGSSTSIVGHSDSTTINVGNAGTTQGIRGALTLSNPPHHNLINIDDSADPTPRNVTFDTYLLGSTYGRITGLGAVISYKAFDTASPVSVLGGFGGNVYNIISTTFQTLNLNTGAGVDATTIRSTSGPVNLEGNNGADSVAIGDVGNAQNILGAVKLTNVHSHNILSVDDSLDPTGRTVVISSYTDGGGSVFGSITGLAPAAINYKQNDTGSPVGVYTGAGDDSVTLSNTTAFQTLDLRTGAGNDIVSDQSVGAAVTYNGGAGSNTLFGPNGGGVWNVTGADTGNLGLVTFVAVGTLTGSFSADAFVFSNGASLSGVVNGGFGANSISYAAYTTPVNVNIGAGTATGTGGTTSILSYVGGSGSDTLTGPNVSATWNITGTNAGTIAAGATYSFSGFENLIGGSASDAFVLANGAGVTGVINGGAGTNTLTGPNATNSWSITATNAGSVGAAAFSAFANLVGGTGNDTFTFANGKGVTGTINGGAGVNTLNYAAYTTPVAVNLTAGTATGTGGVSNIQNVTGGTGNDSITGNASANVLAGGGGVDALNGGGGADTFVLAATQAAGTTVGGGGAGSTLDGANITNTWNLTGAGSGNVNGTVTYSGIANLVGGSVTDSFKFASGGSVAGTINGGLGNNTLDYSGNGGVAIAVNLQTLTATATGGFSNVQFLVGSTATTNALVAANTTNSWNLTGANVGTDGGFHFSAIANLTGGTGVDAFSVAAGASLSGKFDGGLGANTLTYASYGAAVTVNLQTHAATALAGGFANIQTLVGSAATTNTLVGPNAANTWNITATNAGNVAGVAFSAFQNLTGGTLADTFKFSNGKNVTGAINGGGGVDTLDYSAYNTGVTVNLTTGAATGTGGVSNIQNVTGGTGNDSITGNASANVLAGGGGVDTLNGGGGGADTFVLASAEAAGTTVGGGGAGSTLDGANLVNTWSLTGAGSGNVNGTVTYSGIANLVGGTSTDSFKFKPGGSVAGTINGGLGVNTLDYSGNGGAVVTVNLQTHTATGTGGFSNIGALIGGTATTNTLVGANATNTWSITGNNAGSVNGFTFSAIANLTGGTGKDLFLFSNGKGVTGTITGGGGADWLDYAAYTTAVTANLTTGAATGTGGVSGVQNVRGGSGGNTLTGNALGNILIGGAGVDHIVGGTGRSILIGGKGGDTVTGGSGDDIVIGGNTTYDPSTLANDLALESILAEWQSANAYATRVSNIKNGGGLNGTNKLVFGTTVLDDGVADTLTGGAGTDWFFKGATDTITDLQAGEQVN